MPRRFMFVWTGLALLMSLEISGCSLIGYGIGSAIDAGRVGRPRPGDRSLIFKLQRGSKLVVRMADGTTVGGTYRGLVEASDPDYARRYAAWCDSATLAFRPPRIGESIRIEHKDDHSMASKTLKGVFQGFGPQRVHYRPRGSRAESEPFSRIRRILDSSGNVITQADLEQASDRLPVQLIAVVRRGSVDRRVDLLDNRIVEFRFAQRRNGFRTTGLVVGVLADATLILAAAALASYASSSSSCQPTYTGGGFYSGTMPTLLDAMPDSMYVLPVGAAEAMAAR